ncbi:hypothetical protein EDC96DRAFT_257057 [Choanephora cucurbitarum]|nr:hypothetical protein EDC96DRAFT_257057 [Choanephora cucurbitarum]
MSLRSLTKLRGFSPNLRLPRISPLLPRQTCYSTRTQTPPRSIRIPPLPIALISAGFICLGIGLYDHLTSDIQSFPSDVRQSLRKALYYQQTKDFRLSLKYFQEALALALDSPDLDPHGAPLTGIMIQMGALQETMDQLPEARQTLILALRHLLHLSENDDITTTQVSDSYGRLEQKKMMGIAQKLGDVAVRLHRYEEAEKWYVWSVEHLLQWSSRPISDYGDSTEVLFDAEHMPDWLTKTEIGAALEALGGLYATQHKPGLAIQLYLKALTLTGMVSCQASVLMNNLAEAYAGLGQFEEAKMWGQKGLDLARNPNTSKVNQDGALCDETCGVLLFNMGMLFEQTNDKLKAEQFYKSAKLHGREFKQPDCIQQADRALRRLTFEKTRDGL